MPKAALLLMLCSILALLGAGGCSMHAQQAWSDDLQATTLKFVRQQSKRLYQLEKSEAQQLTDAEQAEVRTLKSKLAKFEQYVIATANQLERHEKWEAAHRVYLQALKNMPKSTLLDSVFQRFSERRKLREEIVRTEMAIHRAEKLLKDADAYQRLRQVKGPGFFTWLELNRYQGQCQKSANELQRFANNAVERQDYYLARRGLVLAQRLYGEERSTAVEQGLAFVNDKLNGISTRNTKYSSKKQRRIVLESRFQQGLQEGNLILSRRSFEELQQQYPHYKNLLSFEMQLKAQLNIRVATAIEQGKDFYSEGKLEQALQVWRQAKKLDPDNVELLASIARAETVLANLRDLSSKNTHL